MGTISHGWKPGALWEDMKVERQTFNHIDRVGRDGEKTWALWMTGLQAVTTARSSVTLTKSWELATAWRVKPLKAERRLDCPSAPLNTPRGVVYIARCYPSAAHPSGGPEGAEGTRGGRRAGEQKILDGWSARNEARATGSKHQLHFAPEGGVRRAISDFVRTPTFNHPRKKRFKKYRTEKNHESACAAAGDRRQRNFRIRRIKR